MTVSGGGGPRQRIIASMDTLGWSFLNETRLYSNVFIMRFRCR